MVYWGFGQAATPPGTDPGHWIAVSRAFIGQPYPAQDFTLQPFLYPPLTFPLVGVVLAATGSPITTGFLLGGLLLVGFGLSLIHLSRRFLLSGPFQVLFVGLAILNGTTLQILFWGGYPNFLALILFNEALIFLLAFARTRSMRDGLVLYVLAALIYLTHDLTFAIFLATLATVAVFLIVEDRRWLRLILSWPNVFGLILLAGTALGYSVATAAAGIGHPGYLFSNPAAFAIDNLGELFRPLGYAPLWLPIGTPVAFDPVVVLALLVALSAFIFTTVIVVRRRRPDWVPPRVSIAAASLTATLLVPVGGYLLHIDTDYARFIFFFPLPIALIFTLLVERMGRAWISTPNQVIEVHGPGQIEVTDATPRPTRWSLSPRRRFVLVNAGIATTLILLSAGVSIPTIDLSEDTYATASHDAGFVRAMNWLRADTASGAVLADTSDSQRWVEALAGRNAIAPGDTWLQFYASQILTDQESFLALNSHYVVSNNQAVVSVGGFPTGPVSGLLTGQQNLSLWSQAPLYSVIIQGIIQPVIRISTASLAVIITTNNISSTILYDAAGVVWVPSPVVYTASPVPSLAWGFQTPYFWFNESVSVGSGGAATIAVIVTPVPNVQVNYVNFNLFQPKPTAADHWFPVQSITQSSVSGRFNWTTAAKLGQLPGTYLIQTSGSIQPIPTFSHQIPKTGAPIGQNLSFLNVNPDSAFRVTMTLTTAGTGNPATSLPTYLDTEQFLGNNDIHFLVIQNESTNVVPIAYYLKEFGFHWTPGSNSKWTVLSNE